MTNSNAELHERAIERAVNATWGYDAYDCVPAYREIAGKIIAAYLTIAPQAPVSAVPDGWQLVPKDLTHEMEDAAWESNGADWIGENRVLSFLDAAWEAMLAASPPPPPEADTFTYVVRVEGAYREGWLDRECEDYLDVNHGWNSSDTLRALTALATPPIPPAEAHPDDIAVDRFAAAMKAKLAKKRDEGRGGWDDKEDCSQLFLSSLLREHVEKGDPLDVGNLAMMLHQRDERITCPSVQPVANVGAAEAHERGVEAIARKLHIFSPTLANELAAEFASAYLAAYVMFDDGWQSHTIASDAAADELTRLRSEDEKLSWLLSELKSMRGIYKIQSEDYTSHALHKIISEFEVKFPALSETPTNGT